MELKSGALADAGYTLAQAGTIVGKAAEIKQSDSALGQTMSGITALMIGARLVPGAGRLFRRNPFLGTLLIAGTLGALFLVFSRTVRPDPDLPVTPSGL